MSASLSTSMSSLSLISYGPGSGHCSGGRGGEGWREGGSHRQQQAECPHAHTHSLTHSLTHQFCYTNILPVADTPSTPCWGYIPAILPRQVLSSSRLPTSDFKFLCDRHSLHRAHSDASECAMPPLLYHPHRQRLSLYCPGTITSQTHSQIMFVPPAVYCLFHVYMEGMSGSIPTVPNPLWVLRESAPVDELSPGSDWSFLGLLSAPWPEAMYLATALSSCSPGSLS